MRGATPLVVIEEIKKQKRANRFYTALIFGCAALVLFAEPLIEKIL